jgi:phosphopantothenoylcysteine synthetase/decarboxylase
MKILITGGPVHAKLDAVKIITNTFKGGLMADLADRLKMADPNGIHITYLTSKGSKCPVAGSPTILYHDGFHDYMKQVVELAPKYDAVILGAAVAKEQIIGSSM